jgi:pimeloyl-ACP methyl ester carboxylesterase
MTRIGRLRRMRGFAAGVAGLVLIGTSAMSAHAQSPQIEAKSYTIPSGDPGIDLFIRNKHQAGVQQYGPDRILLFVHGATYPAETAFDLPIEGVSMMDLFAQHGYDVYLVDVRGYGGSTRPPEMSKPASENKPIVSTEVAAKDLGAAVDHILKTRGVAKIDVMGWSWGTAIAGMYTSEHNDKVNRLVQYAPLWLFRKDTAVLAPAPAATGTAPPQLGAYRLVSKASAKDRWLKGVADDKKAGLIPPGVFEQWADATWATDPESGKQNPPMLRAPNGVLDDINKTFAAGKPQYDPGKITVPTLLIHAEWDADLPSYQAQDYFKMLTNAPYRRFVELSEGTHTVMLEKNRMQFFREILNFLNEERPLALK